MTTTQKEEMHSEEGEKFSVLHSSNGQESIAREDDGGAFVIKCNYTNITEHTAKGEAKFVLFTKHCCCQSCPHPHHHIHLFKRQVIICNEMCLTE